MLVEALITEFSLEAFNVGVLSWFPWLNEVQFDAVCMRPDIQYLTDEFRPVVNSDDLGQAPGQCYAL